MYSTGLQRYSVGDITAKAATKMFIPAAAAGSHSSNAFLRCGEMAVSQVRGQRTRMIVEGTRGPFYSLHHKAGFLSEL